MREALSEGEKDRLLDAVRRAERGVSGELVPYLVRESDPYPEAPWLGAAWGALLAGLALFLRDALSPLWVGPSSVLAALGSAALAGALLSRVPAVRRVLIGKETLERRVRRRANEAFLEKEVFRTRARTGILVFVSLFERRVVVLGDSAIAAKVDEAGWSSVTGPVAEGFRSGEVVAGLEKGLAACRELLLSRGFAAGEGDVNELPDEAGGR